MSHPVVVFAPEGDFIELKSEGYKAPQTKKHERGQIKEFSRKSRSRLLKKVATLKRDIFPYFVTLTYPNQFPSNWKIVKYHAHKFWIYLLRQYPFAGGIWKLEKQERGAYHFHILLYGVSLSDAMVFIPQCWYEIAGAGDEKHLAWHRGELGNGNEHCVQPIRSWQGVKSYASKYFTKEETIEGGTGRIWGVRGRVPYSVLIEMKIDVKTALEFRRAFRKWSGFKSKRFGFWAYNQSPIWQRFIKELETQRIIENIPENFPPGWYRNIDLSGQWSSDPLDCRFNDNPLDFF